jgi:hypothetical protein
LPEQKFQLHVFTVREVLIMLTDTLLQIVASASKLAWEYPFKVFIQRKAKTAYIIFKIYFNVKH